MSLPITLFFFSAYSALYVPRSLYVELGLPLKWLEFMTNSRAALCGIFGENRKDGRKGQK